MPIVFLQNSLYHDDFDMIDNNQANIEQSSETLRARAAMIAAVSVSKVPKVCVLEVYSAHFIIQQQDNILLCRPKSPIGSVSNAAQSKLHL